MKHSAHLIELQMQTLEAGLKHLAHTIVIHDLHKDGEGLFFRHLSGRSVIGAQKGQ